MIEQIAPVLVTLIIFFFTAYTIRLNLEHRTRQKLIDKGLTDGPIKNLSFSTFAPQGPSSLKWGIVSTALGLGLFLRIMADKMIDIELRDEFTLGILFFLAGVGLIVYYFIAKKLSNEESDK